MKKLMKVDPFTNSASAFLSSEALLVKNALIEQGLETPMIETGLSSEQKYERIRDLMADVVSTLGLDLTDDSLQETPHRIAKMYVNEVFSGLNYKHFPRISLIENKMKADEMVKVSDIGLTSTCEHHFVTIDGMARVAYIPSSKIIGLSKINRIVRLTIIFRFNIPILTPAPNWGGPVDCIFPTPASEKTVRREPLLRQRSGKVPIRVNTMKAYL